MEKIQENINLNNLDKSQWESHRFEHIAKSISERVEPTQTDLDIYVGLEHLDPDDIHIRRFGKREDVSGTKLRCYPGDMIFGRRRAYQRKAAMVTFDGFCSAHSLVLRANPDIIDPELFPFFLHSDQFMHRAVDISVGSLSPTINWGTLKNEEFLLPPNDQQARLARLLWALDEVMEREREVLDGLENLYICLFKKFKLSGKSWERIKIKDIMQFHYGKPLKESDRFNGKYPVVSSSGIQGFHNEYFTEGPGIVVGRKGNAGEVIWVNDDFWTIDTAYFVTINEEFSHLPMKFFYYLLISANLKALSIATAVPGLNRNDALLTNVYLPGEREVLEYLQKFEQISKRKTDLKGKINKSKDLKKSIINQIF